MTVEKLSLTLALGISIGIIPVLGVSTILLTILALVFKLKIPAIQLVNYGIAAVKYVLLVPFLKLGQMIFFPNKADLQLNNIIEQYCNPAQLDRSLEDEISAHSALRGISFFHALSSIISLASF